MRIDDVADVVEKTKQEVRRVPRDAKQRTFLFQLFCVTAEWDRALTQLRVVAELDPAALPMAQTYEAAIRCELLRDRVFAGTTTPTVLGEPAPWMSLLIEATRLLAAGHGAQGADLRDEAFESAPASAGTLEATPFTWIADADPRLGPMIEAIVDGKYLWVPYVRIRSLRTEPPADLRDQIWMPTQFTWTNGGEATGFVPTRYPGSSSAGDPCALARATEWREEDGWHLPVGQRMLVTDTGAEAAIMDLRCLDLDDDEAPAAAA